MKSIGKWILPCLTAGLVSVAFLGSAADETSATASETSATASSGAASASGLKPIALKLPKPVFVGTPKNINVPNLEAPVKERPPLMAPPDVTNLALKKDVKASDDEPIVGEADMITDGDKEAADGSYVEFGPGVQWVQIDLGSENEIWGIVVWHYHQQARVYNDVVVKTADDPDFTTNVHTVFNNDHDNSAKLGLGKDKAYIETNEGKTIDAKGVPGRYVRLYSNGNTGNEMNDYIEVEVYGRPVKK
jgi:hypothetical protein